MKKNKLSIHYIICVAAILVLLWALFLIYKDPQRTKSLILTAISCALVAIGQVFIIRKKKNSK